MTINARGLVSTTAELRALAEHYKKEGYNHLMKVTTDQFGLPVTPSHYWAVDFQVKDPTVNGLVRYKIVYVGTPETFLWWQRELAERLEKGNWLPLIARPSDGIGVEGVDVTAKPPDKPERVN